MNEETLKVLTRNEDTLEVLTRNEDTLEVLTRIASSLENIEKKLAKVPDNTKEPLREEQDLLDEWLKKLY
ncbi:hypothetical protein [Anaeromicrobium sediminis]|uniref:Uncharacterized protein n=1 Tax=Anaeromicrobium sediminis TaxID=1478221 RepID=A0A267MQ50_9FIRM|nr:hypothetical protein [Anaeromicrobium sediminis]PAB61018.1 hypothetical protein CCE28_00890 [Anaeromicrobium sediminis]